MTRLLAFADTQIGVATVDLVDQREVLDRIVQVALDRKVDSVVHGGDVFEGPVVTPEQLRMFIDGIRPLRDAGIPLLVQRGNGRHDLATRAVHALDVLRELDGVEVLDSPAVCILADKVAVCTLPWVHPGRLIASMNGSLTHEEADLTTSQMLVRIAEHLHRRAQRLQADLPTVLLAHWALSGSAVPTGLPVEQTGQVVLSWADLDAIGYDAIIGAHIHKGQRIDNPNIDNTLGIVVGSPQPLSHGEGGYDHGCWLIGIDEEGAGAEFVPIQSKHFITHDYRPDMPVQPFVSGDVVRVRYTATEEEARRIDHDAIRRGYMEGPTYPSRVTIEPQIIRASRARAETISEQMSHEEAMLAYCKAQELSATVTAGMLERLKTWGES